MSSRITWSALVASALAGVLFALAFLVPLLAGAQSGPAISQAVEFRHLGLDEFLMRAGVAALIVFFATRFLREFFPAMADGSTRAKRLTGGACIALGTLLGLTGFAPAVAPGIAGGLLGGFGAGGIAYFCAGMLGSRLRREIGGES